MNRVVFSSLSTHWNTPKEVYDKLDDEFHFKDDPCPVGGMFGLDRKWVSPSFVNPPYGQVGKWIQKGYEESTLGVVSVFLIPARTDTKWFHNFVLPYAKDVRFIRGRLKFGDAKNSAPFPSMIVIFGESND
jgi:hypothetical protein